MSDYALARLEADHKHQIFTDPRGIEPAIIYCPEKKGFTYAELLFSELLHPPQPNAICGHCYKVIDI